MARNQYVLCLHVGVNYSGASGAMTHKFSKGDKVSYGPFIDAKVIEPDSGDKGDRVEITTLNDTHICAEKDGVRKQ